MTLHVFSHLVDGNVSGVIDCEFVRENECDVVMSCQKGYLLFYLGIFVFLIGVKISSI